jgi:hypothetical protein
MVVSLSVLSIIVRFLLLLMFDALKVDVEPVQVEDRGSAPCCRYHRQVAAIEWPLPG